jgi:hypothetical protein
VTRLLERSLAESPADRYPDGAAVAEDLLHLLHSVESRTVNRARATAPLSDPRSQPAPSVPAVPDSWPQPSSHRGEPEDDGTCLYDETVAAARASGGLAAAIPLEERSLRRNGRVGGWLLRAGAAAWSFLLTAAATSVFAGSWFAAFLGISSGDVDLVYAGTAASVLATPLALHRLMGRRGLLGLGVFASLAATLTCVYWLGAGRMELVLGAVFAAQLAVCIAVERLTARGPAAAEPPVRPVEEDSERTF